MKIKINFLVLFLPILVFSQKYKVSDSKVTFFSYAPVEDIKAESVKLQGLVDFSNKEFFFRIPINSFVFPSSLMQEHFNENYLESDVYPNSIFQAEVLGTNVKEIGDAKVEGDLTIHGVTNKIFVDGFLLEKDNKIIIKANFSIKLKDYKIKIPKIVMYKIAEEIAISVNIELKEIK